MHGPSPTPYVELRAKSAFSFLEGASQPGELIEKAHALGLAGLALSDRNGVYGMPRAWGVARTLPDFRFLVGSELTLCAPEPPLSLLARTRAGYGLLCRLITAAHEGREKGAPELPLDRLASLLNEFPDAARGLFAFHFVQPGASEGPLRTLRELFEPDSEGPRLFLQLGRFLDGKDRERTNLAKKWALAFGAPIVATADVHSHAPERRPLQDVLTCLRHGRTLQSAGRLLFPNAERTLLTPERMRARFADLPEALSRTVSIAERCPFLPSELRYRYPSEWIPAGETAQSHLEKLTWEGARRRYCEELRTSGIPSAVQAQLEHELKLIRELDFADYFLTIWEIVEFAKSRGILCQGRGSAANSAVCFVLGITAVDPVRMNLLFERFISAERGEPPDIDVDFEHERREEVIQHVYEKYGRHRAAMVSAVITFRSRLARREISKVLEVPLERADEDPRLVKLSEEIYGFPRHLSIHSGGFTLSADPLIETVPVEPARMEDRTIIQWDKQDLETIGLLKVDLLSLGMLSAIRRTLALLPNPLTLAAIPRLLPKTFYDLVVQVAIVRPGPIQGGMVHPYLRRRRGLESPELPDPRLEPILAKTLGVPLFQEQIMKVAILLADFTPGEADELRRAIGAWRSSGSIQKMGQKLRDGLARNGVPPEFAERIFQQIQGFAQYGFPESHAASFALLSYASCYLKRHHPAEFLCALLNSQPMGFYAPHTLIDDARRHGVEVLPVSPSRSTWESQMEGRAVRLGLQLTQGIRQDACEELIAAREERPFQNLRDFLNRTRLRASVLHKLALGDAFREWRMSQRDALWEILEARPLLSSAAPGNEGQLSLFPLITPGSSVSAGKGGVRFHDLKNFEAVQADYDAFGASTRGHPMQALRKQLPEKLETSLHVRSAPAGRKVRTAGLLIVRQSPETAKGVTFCTLEDEYGFLDLILYPDTKERFSDVLNHFAFVGLEGLVQRDGEAVSVLVRSLTPLKFDEDLEERSTEPSRPSSENTRGSLPLGLPAGLPEKLPGMPNSGGAPHTGRLRF
jgi:error-prone DNA polymerase